MEALHVGGGRPRSSHSHSQSSTYSSHAVSLAPAMAPGASSDSDGGSNMRGMDSNLTALCEHVQGEGWKSKAFSDIVVKAMGHTFHLHRLLLSRSSYFRSGSLRRMSCMKSFENDPQLLVGLTSCLLRQFLFWNKFLSLHERFFFSPVQFSVS